MVKIKIKIGVNPHYSNKIYTFYLCEYFFNNSRKYCAKK